jgi:hypothetical protein
MTSVSDTMVSVCMSVSVSVCVCVISLALFQVEFRVLVSSSRPNHVNQGGVQKVTPQVTLQKSLSGDTEVADTDDQHLNTILPSPFFRGYINKVFLLTVFLKGFFAGTCDLRLLTNRLTILMLGHLGLFAWFTLSHTLFRTICRYQKTRRQSPQLRRFPSCSRV